MVPQTKLPEALLDRLGEVRSVGIITGAGVSRESGIPTYRGVGGLYDDPETGERTVEALSGPTLQRDPDRTWRAVAELARLAGPAAPNPAHHAIAAIEKKVERFVLLTQNVDGLHQRAGSRNVIDIHGSIFRTRCDSCGRRGHLDPGELGLLSASPRCIRCEGILRPDAVLFEELLPLEKIQRIHLEFHVELPDLVVAAGTSALFPYIAEPFLHACRTGRLAVEINPDATSLSENAAFHLRDRAGAALPAIERALTDSLPAS